jgi:hypothetical protein
MCEASDMRSNIIANYGLLSVFVFGMNIRYKY